LTENFDFDTVTGKFVLGILGLVAELERQLIAQRTAAGIAAHKAAGGIWGRERKMTKATLEQAEKMLQDGLRADAVAKKLKVALSSIYTYFWIKDGVVRRKRVKSKAK